LDNEVTLERRGQVAIITIDRQHVRNAFDPIALRRLTQLLRDCHAEGARAAVLTGAGSASFSSGMDLRAMGSESPESLAATVAAFNAALDDEERIPLIAAVNGPASGGGFEVALRCDLIVAAATATFRLPEVQRGIVPGGGATLLPNRLPIAIALELGIVGEAITAQRAYELGLVNAVVTSEQVIPTALNFAERIARNGPLAVARTRALMWQTALDGSRIAWARAQDSSRDPLLRQETTEGVAAFIDKREPRWSADT
jgi:enoyl-CoA hydratase